jgi:hypothetical protein
MQTDIDQLIHALRAAGHQADNAAAAPHLLLVDGVAMLPDLARMVRDRVATVAAVATHLAKANIAAGAPRPRQLPTSNPMHEKAPCAVGAVDILWLGSGDWARHYPCPCGARDELDADMRIVVVGVWPSGQIHTGSTGARFCAHCGAVQVGVGDGTWRGCNCDASRP